MLAGYTWGVSALRCYHFKKFSFCQCSRCTNLCREMVRAVIPPQCNMWLSFWAVCCLCNVSSHLFNVPSEHAPASGTNCCYASTLLRGITSLSGSEYCGSCSNGPFFIFVFILRLQKISSRKWDSSPFPTNWESVSQAEPPTTVCLEWKYGSGAILSSYQLLFTRLVRTLCFNILGHNSLGYDLV